MAFSGAGANGGGVLPLPVHLSDLSDEDEMECPLCMEEIDISDRYFKPCPCSYQICRFCYNHIKENLNGLCPACRRQYNDETIEWKPVPQEQLLKYKASKKRKERERKEHDQANRRHLQNVRVVQKNLVYALGLPAKISTEEVLRSNDFFGQYGKIIKIVVNRRNHAHTPVLPNVANTGVYITYARKEDAQRAIDAVDSVVFDGKVVRATFGTTKYCSSFLKGQACQLPACQYLHELAEEADQFAKEEAVRQQQREKNAKPPPFPTFKPQVEREESALPATANWGKPNFIPSPTSATAVGSGLHAGEPSLNALYGAAAAAQRPQQKREAKARSQAAAAAAVAAAAAASSSNASAGATPTAATASAGGRGDKSAVPSLETPAASTAPTTPAGFTEATQVPAASGSKRPGSPTSAATASAAPASRVVGGPVSAAAAAATPVSAAVPATTAAPAAATAPPPPPPPVVLTYPLFARLHAPRFQSMLYGAMDAFPPLTLLPKYIGPFDPFGDMVMTAVTTGSGRVSDASDAGAAGTVAGAAEGAAATSVGAATHAAGGARRVTPLFGGATGATDGADGGGDDGDAASASAGAASASAEGSATPTGADDLNDPDAYLTRLNQPSVPLVTPKNQGRVAHERRNRTRRRPV